MQLINPAFGFAPSTVKWRTMPMNSSSFRVWPIWTSLLVGEIIVIFRTCTLDTSGSEHLWTNAQNVPVCMENSETNRIKKKCHVSGCFRQTVQMWFSLFSSMFYVQNIYELRISVANDCENSSALCSTGLLMIPDDGLAVDNVLWQVELINHAQGNGPTAWLAVVHFPFDEESLHSILDSWSDSCSLGGRHPKYSGNCCFTSFPGLPRTNITSQFRVATCATHLVSWSWDVSNLIRSKAANMTNDFFTKYWTYNLSKEV